MCNGLVKTFIQLLNTYTGSVEKRKISTWINFSWIDLTSQKHECEIHIKSMDQSNLISVFHTLWKKSWRAGNSIYFKHKYNS